MKVKYILIFLIFSLLYFLINYYIGRKMLNGFNYIFKISPLIFWVIFWALALSYVISMLLNKFISPNLTNFLYLAGSYWMGLLMYTLLTFPIIGIINIIVSKSHLSNNLTDKYYIYQTLLITIIFK